MISDRMHSFSVNQSLAGSTPNGNFIMPAQNSVDLSVARDIGNGMGLYVRFQVGTAFTAGGSTTPRLHPCLVYADDQILLTNPTIVSMVGGSNYILTTDGGVPGGLLESALTAGATFYLPVPPMSVAVSGLTAPSHVQRYFGVVYFQLDYVGNWFSAGTMSADIVQAPGDSLIGGYPAATSL